MAEDEAFDVQAAIDAFLADPLQGALELPHMTTGQRKYARKLAERHPDLRCESFGLGADRQLHLFKDGGYGDNEDEAAIIAGLSGTRGPVSVKNTFIDDWIEAERDGAGVEPMIFRSMPPRLNGSALRSFPVPLEGSGGGPDLQPICEKGWDQAAFEPVPASCSRQPPGLCLGFLGDLTSPGRCSTSASVISGAASSSEAPGSPASSAPPLCYGEQLPVLPAGLVDIQVRNTFIHMHAANADDRAVQSMPRGMFGRCLQEEAAAYAAWHLHESSEAPGLTLPTSLGEVRAAAGFSAVLSPHAAAFEPGSLGTQVAAMCHAAAVPDPVKILPDAHAAASYEPGTEIVVEGLSRAPAFNGLHGVVQSLDEETGRYSVVLTSATFPSGRQLAKVKAENLRLLSPLPAEFPLLSYPPPPPLPFAAPSTFAFGY